MHEDKLKLDLDVDKISATPIHTEGGKTRGKVQLYFLYFEVKGIGVQAVEIFINTCTRVSYIIRESERALEAYRKIKEF